LCLVVACLILSTTMGEMLNTKNCGLNEILERKINRTSYIVGGRTAGAGVWPWACSVGFTKQNMWEHYCGGTLVTPRHVLTAAHCLVAFEEQRRAQTLQVRCGDFNLLQSDDDQYVQVGDVAYYDLHDSYEYGLTNYDVGILHLKTSFQENDNFIRPICLKRISQNLEDSNAVAVIGWGAGLLDERDQVGQELKIATLEVFSDDYCEAVVSRDNRTGVFGEDLFCAGDSTGSFQGSCNGDSGGPVFSLTPKQSRYELIGLINSGENCGLSGLPSVFTNINHVPIHHWIVETVSGCKNGHLACVPKEECPQVKEMYLQAQARAPGSKNRRRLIKELRSLVCDKDQRLFCCTLDDDMEDKAGSVEGVLVPFVSLVQASAALF